MEVFPLLKTVKFANLAILEVRFSRFAQTDIANFYFSVGLRYLNFVFRGSGVGAFEEKGMGLVAI